MANLYPDDTEEQNPPVEDFLVWRDLRVFDGKVPSPFVLCQNQY